MEKIQEFLQFDEKNWLIFGQTRMNEPMNAFQQSALVNHLLSFALTALKDKWQIMGPLLNLQVLMFTQRFFPEDTTDQGFAGKKFALPKYPISRLDGDIPSRIAIQHGPSWGRKAGMCIVRCTWWLSGTEIIQV